MNREYTKAVPERRRRQRPAGVRRLIRCRRPRPLTAPVTSAPGLATGAALVENQQLRRRVRGSIPTQTGLTRLSARDVARSPRRRDSPPARRRPGLVSWRCPRRRPCCVARSGRRSGPGVATGSGPTARAPRGPACRRRPRPASPSAASARTSPGAGTSLQASLARPHQARATRGRGDRRVGGAARIHRPRLGGARQRGRLAGCQQAVGPGSTAVPSGG